MRRMTTAVCLLAMLSGGVCAQSSPAKTGAPHPHAARPSPAPAVHAPHPAKAVKRHGLRRKLAPAQRAAKSAVPVAPPAPPPAAELRPQLPPTLMDSPPVAPNVLLQNGRLTIDAPNSLLSDVLREVQKATGAEIEGSAGAERVAVRLGPADPRQVIAALLEGTPYDYLILGSADNPDAVTRIVLTPAEGSPAPAAQAAGSHPQPPAAHEPPAEPENEPSLQQEIVGTQVEQPVRPPVQPNQPQPNQGQPNTPEQLFRELMPQAQPPQPQPQQQEH